MSSLANKIITPQSILIEKTAGEFAANFYEGCRNSNMKVIMLQGKRINLMNFKGPRQFARAHLEKFIPAALEALITIMGNDKTHPDQKEIIYQAIMERTNDEQVNAMGQAAGLPEFEKTILYKPDDEKPKPIIVNTPKLDLENG